MMPGTPPQVATPPAAPPPAGMPHEAGPSYGIQSLRSWDAGDVGAKEIAEAGRAVFLWRLSVFGAVDVDLTYGTKMNRALTGLRAPVVLTIPGQFVALARPFNAEHTGVTCEVTLTQASGSARSQARNFIDQATGGALDPSAVSFVALTASQLNISGAVVNVPALSSVPLVSGAVLVSGSGFQEFEA
jgi:hypothetical protein